MSRSAEASAVLPRWRHGTCFGVRPARGTKVLTSGVMRMLCLRRNENAMSIAFAVERNSGMDRGGLANLSAFVAVADQRSFRAAASRLDVTPSALSHSMRQLE